MNANRRGFFGAIVGLTAGCLVPPSRESDAARELREVSEAFARLRVQMEQPIKLTIHLDGRKVAKQAVEFIPQMVREQGLR
jgi:hypothetical protein